MKAPPNSAWFYCRDAATLFVGVSGGNYPDSHEIEPCHTMTREAADDVVMRQIVPWQAALVPPDKGITLYFRSVQPEP